MISWAVIFVALIVSMVALFYYTQFHHAVSMYHKYRSERMGSDDKHYREMRNTNMGIKCMREALMREGLVDDISFRVYDENNIFVFLRKGKEKKALRFALTSRAFDTYEEVSDVKTDTVQQIPYTQPA